MVKRDVFILKMKMYIQMRTLSQKQIRVIQSIVAQMPGSVTEVKVSVGETVKA